jgi:hypothetical protein
MGGRTALAHPCHVVRTLRDKRSNRLALIGRYSKNKTEIDIERIGNMKLSINISFSPERAMALSNVTNKFADDGTMFVQRRSFPD